MVTMVSPVAGSMVRVMTSSPLVPVMSVASPRLIIEVSRFHELSGASHDGVPDEAMADHEGRSAATADVVLRIAVRASWTAVVARPFSTPACATSSVIRASSSVPSSVPNTIVGPRSMTVMRPRSRPSEVVRSRWTPSRSVTRPSIIEDVAWHIVATSRSALTSVGAYSR